MPVSPDHPNLTRAELAMQVFAEMPLGVSVWHLEEPEDPGSLRFVMSNKLGDAMMQRSAEERVGKTIYELHPKEHVQPLAEAYARAARERTVIDLGDIRYPTPGGEVRYLRVRVVPLSHRYLASLFSDATAQVEALATLASRTEALERSNRDLEDFARVVSHDLREPLRKVTAFGDRLQRRAAEALDERSQDYLERMVDAAGRMQSLIDDLLTYSRVRASAQPFVDRPLGRVVDSVLRDLEVRIEQTGGQVQVGPLPVVHGDPTQLRQLLQNLIGNGLKFHREGHPPKVAIQALEGAPAGFVRIEVRDEGVGFEPRFAEQIFGVFERLHSRSAFEGSGIGLAVCKRIVERHGGSIIAEGVLGQGARFVFDLPSGGGAQEATAAGGAA